MKDWQKYGDVWVASDGDISDTDPTSTQAVAAADAQSVDDEKTYGTQPDVAAQIPPVPAAPSAPAVPAAPGVPEPPAAPPAAPVQKWKPDVLPPPKDPVHHALRIMESSDGADKNHVPTRYGTAGGSYGVLPGTFKDVVDSHPDLAKKYGQFTHLSPDEIKDALNSNDQMAEDVGTRYFDDLLKRSHGDLAQARLRYYAGAPEKEGSGANLYKKMLAGEDLHGHSLDIALDVKKDQERWATALAHTQSGAGDAATQPAAPANAPPGYQPSIPAGLTRHQLAERGLPGPLGGSPALAEREARIGEAAPTLIDQGPPGSPQPMGLPTPPSPYTPIHPDDPNGPAKRTEGVGVGAVTMERQPDAAGVSQMADASGAPVASVDSTGAVTNAPAPAAPSTNVDPTELERGPADGGEAAALSKVAGSSTDPMTALQNRILAKQDEIQRMLATDPASKSKVDALEQETSNWHPKDYWADKSMPAKIMAHIALAMGAAGAALAHTPNFAAEIIQHAVDTDLERQKLEMGKKNNLLALATQRMGNEEQGQRAAALIQTRVLNSMVTELSGMRKAQAGPQLKEGTAKQVASIEASQKMLEDYKAKLGGSYSGPLGNWLSKIPLATKTRIASEMKPLMILSLAQSSHPGRINQAFLNFIGKGVADVGETRNLQMAKIALYEQSLSQQKAALLDRAGQVSSGRDTSGGDAGEGYTESDSGDGEE